MASPNDGPLKLRTFRLSDRTYDALQAIAQAMAEEKGVTVSRADVLRILVDKEAKERSIVLKATKKPKSN